MKIINNLPQLLNIQKEISNLNTLLNEKLSEKSDATHNHDDTYLKKTSVINSNTITEAGYALDARQANPNISGSLGAQIDALNETFTQQIGNLNTDLGNKASTNHTHNGLVKYIDKQGTTLSNGNFATEMIINDKLLIAAVPLWNNVTVKGITLSDSQYYLNTDIYSNNIYVRLYYL